MIVENHHHNTLILSRLRRRSFRLQHAQPWMRPQSFDALISFGLLPQPLLHFSDIALLRVYRVGC